MLYKKILASLTALIIILAIPVSALAGTTIYAGSDLTEGGSMVFGRVEDHSPDYAKLFNVYPAGAHLKGEEYYGCYGFQWTFTHDSYAYTGFSNDNSQGICPNCGSRHEHLPYQAGGTNEKGLSVSATETIYANDAIIREDPYINTGIEEAEIATILLGEAASAKEAVLLLTSIYNTYGAYRGAGIFLADSREAWYIENLSGTQYVAVRLNSEILMIAPNVSAIGRIDLDDTQNIIASPALIETAIAAGCFVGDQNTHVIDFAASYEGDGNYSTGSRLAAGLNYLSSSNTFSVYNDGQGIARSAHTISNLDSRGNIVPLYTSVRKAAHKLSLQDIIGFFRTSPIANDANVETHLFQITEGDRRASSSVEWVALGDGRYSIFLPCYPMLTREVHPSYRTGHTSAEVASGKPNGRLSFYTEAGCVVFPKAWSDSMYWIFAALEHIATEDEVAAAIIDEQLRTLQDNVYEEWNALQDSVANAGSSAADTATLGCITIAERVYQGVLGILRGQLDAELLS